MKLNKEILRLAIPNIISNISVPLLSTVDTVLMGYLPVAHIGAVGLGAMIFSFLFWNFGFLRMGTTGFTAQAFGRKDNNEITLVLYRSIIIALILSVVIVVFMKPIANISFGLMHTSTDNVILFTYFKIVVLSAPATLMIYVLKGWLFGLQNSFYPLLATIITNVVNIIASVYFVLYLEQGAAGVARGTVIAQYSGLIILLLIIFLKYKVYLIKMSRELLFQIEGLLRMVNINKDIFLRTLSLTFVFGFFYSQSNLNGELELATNVILLHFLNWMSYGIDGFAYAAESLTGKYFGARNILMIKKSVRLSFLWGGALAVLISFVYLFGGERLLHYFTDDIRVIERALDSIIWIVFLPIIGFASYIWDGIFVGITAAKEMRNSMFVSMVVFLLVYYVFHGVFHNILWIALSVFLLSRALFQQLYYLKIIKKIEVYYE